MTSPRTTANFGCTEFREPSAYVDWLWQTGVGLERAGRLRPQVDLQYSHFGVHFDNEQLALSEDELQLYLRRMGHVLRSDFSAGSGVSVGAVSVDVNAVKAQLDQLKKVDCTSSLCLR